MSSGLPEQIIRGEASGEPLMVDQYHRMIESGSLPDAAGIELIDRAVH